MLAVAARHQRGRVFERVVDHPHLLARSLGAIVTVVHGAQVRAVDKFLLHRQGQASTRLGDRRLAGLHRAGAHRRRIGTKSELDNSSLIGLDKTIISKYL